MNVYLHHHSEFFQLLPLSFSIQDLTLLRTDEIKVRKRLAVVNIFRIEPVVQAPLGQPGDVRAPHFGHRTVFRKSRLVPIMGQKSNLASCDMVLPFQKLFSFDSECHRRVHPYHRYKLVLPLTMRISVMCIPHASLACGVQSGLQRRSFLRQMQGLLFYDFPVVESQPCPEALFPFFEQDDPRAVTEAFLHIIVVPGFSAVA
jgi:hypothetical protein